ncbi:DUF6301 family protein [Nocardia sp. NPDC050406]|uniref:DUF6301 family protein n=1 Tax=Nocardia sp. NPDC050406 TaxID=3364318 RepID=UPI0037AB3C7C
MHADIDEAVRIARLAADFDWTWAAEDVQRFSAAAGWTVVGQRPRERGTDLRTGLDIPDPVGRAIYNRRFFEREGSPEQLISEILVTVTSQVKDATPQRHRWLTNTFADLFDRLVAELGQPSKPSPGDPSHVRWTLSTTVLIVRMDKDSVGLRIVNPIYQQWWDRWTARDDGDEGATDSDDEDSDALPDQPRSWSAFSSALALTLNRLHSDDQVVMTSGQDAIAQFEMDWFKIACFVRADMKDVVVHTIPGTVGAAMTADDWQIGTGPDEGWWQRTLRWPARYEEFEAAAEAVSLALREVIGVGSPTDLAVTGWSNASEYSYPDITAFGIRR